MSQAEELLRNLTKDVPIHDHVVSDQDSYFVINPDTRIIENVSRADNVLMQYDHNSEKYTFELARYVDGHDMTLCNRVRVHFNNVDGATNEENADVAELYDLAIDPDDNSKVLCSWTITRQATQLVGTLNFLVQYECIDDNGNSVYEWHTDIYTDVAVKKGRNNSEQAVIEYSNVLEQWYQRIFGAGKSVMADITAEGEKQVAAVTAEGVAQKEAVALKGEATLATIPDDYTKTYNMAEEAIRRKANTIEMNAEGEAISVNDSSDAYLLGLNIKGRCEQASTTGKNLCPGYKQGAYDNSTGIYSDQFTGYYCSEKVQVVHGTSYVISNGLGKNPSMIHAYDADDNWLGSTAINKLPENVAWIGINYLSTNDLEWIQVEIGTEGTEYEPYSSGIPSPSPEYPQEIKSSENPTVNIVGKNFVNVPESYTFTQFGSIDVNIPAGKYVFSFESESHGGANPPSVRFADNDIWRWLDDEMQNTTMILRKPETRLYFYSNGTAYNGSKDIEATINRFMISKNGGEYEPYKPIQTITINRALHGIPVTSDGNYTDVKGQQWICDEIDFERGVYVQRVGQLTLTKDFNWYYNTDTVGKEFFYTADNSNSNAKAWETRLLCSHFPAIGGSVAMDSDYWTQFSGSGAIRIRHKGLTSLDDLAAWLSENQVTIRYVLAEPVVIPLTEEEIAYYKKLKTYYHNTTVMNDSGARMAIEYSTDTKMFFENHSIATDAQVEKAVNKYLEKNPTNNGMNESDLYNGVTMADRITGRKYIVYISNGKLVMDEE
jgi:hypothetical protein